MKHGRGMGSAEWACKFNEGAWESQRRGDIFMEQATQPCRDRGGQGRSGVGDTGAEVEETWGGQLAGGVGVGGEPVPRRQLSLDEQWGDSPCGPHRGWRGSAFSLGDSDEEIWLSSEQGRNTT